MDLQLLGCGFGSENKCLEPHAEGWWSVSIAEGVVSGQLFKEKGRVGTRVKGEVPEVGEVEVEKMAVRSPNGPSTSIPTTSRRNNLGHMTSPS